MAPMQTPGWKPRKQAVVLEKTAMGSRRPEADRTVRIGRLGYLFMTNSAYNVCCIRALEMTAAS